MCNNYNLVQVCTSLHGRDEDQIVKNDDADGNADLGVIVHSATSASLSYPYLQIPSTSTGTTAVTCLYSTSTKEEVDMLNYVDTALNNHTVLEYESEPIF